MKKHLLASLFIGLVFLLAACGAVTPLPAATPTPLPTATPGMSPEAYAYLTEFLDLVQANSVMRYEVDWEHIRTVAYDREVTAVTPADTYDTIDLVLRMLGDNHSFFWTPEEVEGYGAMTIAENPSPEGRMAEDGIAYLMIAPFLSGDQEEVNALADQIQGLVRDLDAQSPCGWVVDLRQNLGGNMWPMLAGAGELAGEGELGAFVDPDGNRSPWSYRAGQALEGEAVQAWAEDGSFRLQASDAPIAVLIGPYTASSGEAVALSFRGRPDTRFFGQPSMGLTTGNGTFVLSDGAMVVLTTVIMADRTGRVYGGPIFPDQELDETDMAIPVPEAVREWLLSQPACSAGGGEP